MSPTASAGDWSTLVDAAIILGCASGTFALLLWVARKCNSYSSYTKVSSSRYDISHKKIELAHVHGGESGTFVDGGDAQTMKTFTCMIPDPRKDNSLGEDAYFTLELWAGVADGVGGWRSQGIDPGRFSRALMESVKKVVANLSKETQDIESSSMKCVGSKSRVDQVIKWAFQDVYDSQKKLWESSENGYGRSKSRHLVIQGSSTVLLYHLDVNTSSIMATNIGDCELYVFRKMNIVDNSDNNNNNSSTDSIAEYYSIIDRVPAGCFSFNMPYQIGIQLSRDQVERIDSPKTISKRIKVQAGDIIVAGSDGLFDNIFENEISDIVSKHANLYLRRKDNNDYSAWNGLASTLAKLAIRYGKDRKYNSPFSVKACESGDYNMRGGKLDDTTVLVSFIE